jgi:hypothetical protein
MSATIETEQELTEEAFNILRQNLPPHKVARLLSIWQIGKGDYVHPSRRAPKQAEMPKNPRLKNCSRA